MNFRDTLEDAVARAERELREAQTRYDVLRETLRKYNESAGLPARRRGHSGSATKADPTRTRPTKAHPAKTKASRMRAIIVRHATDGVTAPAVVSALQQQGIAAALNAVHAALSKMKKARLVTVKSGRYFPTSRLVE